MMQTIVIEHRGQTLEFCYPSDEAAGLLPRLSSVLDWYERACVTQIPGYEQGEAPSSTIALDNSGRDVERWLDYPLNARVVLRDDGYDVLCGRVTRFVVGPQVELMIEV